MAEEINKHLADGGVVTVATYGKAWEYRPKCAGMFFMHGENLHVKRGKKSDQLSIGNHLLVSIRLYKQVCNQTQTAP